MVPVHIHYTQYAVYLYTVLVAAAVVRVSLANNNKNFLFVYFAEHMIDHLEQF